MSADAVWYAMVHYHDNSILAVSRYADHLELIIRERWGSGHPHRPIVVECLEPQVVRLERVKCEACRGSGHVTRPVAEKGAEPEVET